MSKNWWTISLIHTASVLLFQSSPIQMDLRLLDSLWILLNTLRRTSLWIGKIAFMILLFHFYRHFQHHSIAMDWWKPKNFFMFELHSLREIWFCRPSFDRIAFHLTCTEQSKFEFPRDGEVFCFNAWSTVAANWNIRKMQIEHAECPKVNS